MRLHDEVVFRGTKEQCQAWAAKRSIVFGDGSRHYLHGSAHYWRVVHDWDDYGTWDGSDAPCQNLACFMDQDDFC